MFVLYKGPWLTDTFCLVKVEKKKKQEKKAFYGENSEMHTQYASSEKAIFQTGLNDIMALLIVKQAFLTIPLSNETGLNISTFTGSKVGENVSWIYNKCININVFIYVGFNWKNVAEQPSELSHVCELIL